MKKFRIYLINIFGFSRIESNGVIVLLSLSICCCLLFLATEIYEKSGTERPHFAEWYAQKLAHSVERDKNHKINEFLPSPEPFDPNTSGFKQLVQVGFRPEIAGRIIKFREAGGSFKTYEDLKVVYGMDSELLEKLKPYVNISGKEGNRDLYYVSDHSVNNVENDEMIESELIRVDINEAQSYQLMEVSGIGKVLSERIIKYRYSLGGYNDFNQLNEVYNLPDSLIPELEKLFYIDTSKVIRINVNSDSLKQLASHPYINWNMAKAMLNYRAIHGDFEKTQDLKEIHLITDSIYMRLSPYLFTGYNQ